MKCAFCSYEFDPEQNPGGLLFSPPKSRQVYKHHICPICYEEIERGIKWS